MLSEAKHPCISLKTNAEILRYAQDDMPSAFFSQLLSLSANRAAKPPILVSSQFVQHHSVGRHKTDHHWHLTQGMG